MNFEHGKSYPIETLPDDLHDESLPNRDKWALKDALFWNPCQGWWHESIADYWLHSRTEHAAVFWAPEPPSPMTRADILIKHHDGLVVCPTCDVAIDPPPTPHACRPETIALVEQQRALKAAADARPEPKPETLVAIVDELKRQQEQGELRYLSFWEPKSVQVDGELDLVAIALAAEQAGVAQR